MYLPLLELMTNSPFLAVHQSYTKERQQLRCMYTRVCYFSRLLLHFQDLAEFVLHLGEESESLEEFRAKLKANGSAVTQALAVSLYTGISKFVARTKKAKTNSTSSTSDAAKSSTDSTSPSPVKDAKEESASASSSSSKSISSSKPLPSTAFSVSQHAPTEKELKFPGLCMQNRFDRPELQLERPDEHAPLSAAAQRLLHQEKDERELQREEQEAFKKAKEGPGYWGNNNSNSSSSSKGGLSATGANAVPVGGVAADAAAVDDSLNFCGQKGAPLERYGIYDGVVARVMEYGAFVQLDLAEGRREGLLHVADMSRPDGGPCVNA